MGFENLEAAYADNEDMEKVIKDSEDSVEETIKDDEGSVVENNNTAEGSDIEGEEGGVMEEAVEDNNNSEKIESFEEVGREKLSSMFEKISSFSSNLVESGKKAIYTATGVAFEAPGVVKEVAKETYGSAKESFTGAVDSAKEKALEVKTNLVEKAQEAKKSFLEKITGTKDKYVNKANELTKRGIDWGINAGERVATKVTETHDRIDDSIQKIRIKVLEGRVEKGRIAETRLETLNEEKEVRKNASSMSSLLGHTEELSV